MKSKILQILNEYAKQTRRYGSFDSDETIPERVISESDFPAIAEKIEQLDNWVSVETPPEADMDGERCLVLTHPINCEPEIVFAYWEHLDGFYSAFYDYKLTTVTHWQPLPSKPKNN